MSTAADFHTINYLKNPVKLTKFVAVAGTAEPLVASATMARAIYLQAKKVAADNSANVFIGLSDLDAGLAEMFELTPGSTFEYRSEPGAKFDLAAIYIDALTAADGVVGWYAPS